MRLAETARTYADDERGRDLRRKDAERIVRETLLGRTDRPADDAGRVIHALGQAGYLR